MITNLFWLNLNEILYNIFCPDGFITPIKGITITTS